MITRFLGAIQFLTVLPISARTSSPGNAAIFFPLIGAILGLVAAAVFQIFSSFLNPSLGGLAAVIALTYATGCLHEDGLADVADGIRVGRTPEAMLRIMKDSRIGVYGGVALVASIILRWQAIASMQVKPLLGLATCLALSRSALVVLAGSGPSLGSGLGSAFAPACSGRVIAGVLLQAGTFLLGFAVLADWKRAIILIAACVLVFLLMRAYLLRRLHGFNGDCLGAASQIVEITGLLVLACRLST